MGAIDSDALKEYIKKTDLTAVELGALLQAISNMPTLTPPNEWVNRVRELDELYTKLQIVTGFTAEQLLEIFAAGYTLEKPDYSKKFAEMENLAEAAQPNEPLTLEELREMDGVNALWVHNLAWGLHKPRFMLVHSVSEDWWTCCDFDGFETFCADDYGERYLLYRRPPEVKEEILQEFSSKFDLQMKLFTIEDYGGWDEAYKTFFDDGAMFDEIYGD